MSFAYDVKAELCKVPINRSCCAVAEGCGVLLYASAFTVNEVRIVTENDEFAARLPKLFQKAFSLRFDELPDKSKDGGKLVFRITQEDKLDTIWRALGYDRRAHFALHLNFALLEEECCRASFLRGAFLSGGSVTDPQKRYHLELATSHVQAGREVEALLRDTLVEELPLQPLCKPDCKGLCSQCGIDLNENPDHQHDMTDIRFAALEGLKAKLEGKE